MASNTAIVFGPTGSVGSFTAITAQKNGAKVVLAMRDPSKSIPGLSSEQEKAGGYGRIQADLTKPDTVVEAIKKTQAKNAFIYLAHGMPDHMKSTIQALKDSGIEFVVFLSSFTIAGPIADVPQSELIPFIHAQVEINLEEIFGGQNYVAVRPGGFATNVMFWKKGLMDGDVRIYCPDAKYDYIAPIDMGQVSGTILAKGQQTEGEKHVYLFGPKMTSQRDAVAAISKASGRDIKVTAVDEQAGVEEYVSFGTPRFLAEYLMSRTAGVEKQDMQQGRPEVYAQGVENIKKYLGRDATSFGKWAESNKHLFSA